MNVGRSKPLLDDEGLDDERLDEEDLLNNKLLEELLLIEPLAEELLEEELSPKPPHPIRRVIGATGQTADRHTADPKITFTRLAAFIWLISDLHFE